MVMNQTASVDFSTAATQTVIPAATGKRIVVLGYSLFNGVATAQTVQFRSGANLLSGVIALPSAVGGGQVVYSGSDKVSVFVTDPGVALTMVQSAATQVAGTISFLYS